MHTGLAGGQFRLRERFIDSAWRAAQGAGGRCYSGKAATRLDRDPNAERVSRRCTRYLGFSLHADVRVSGCNRERLEKLIRYAARPAIATERLSEWRGRQRGSNEQGLLIVASCLRARRVGSIAYANVVQERV